MPINNGTRQQQNFSKERDASGSMTKFYTRDLGLKDNFTGSVTFSAGAAQIQGGANVFTGIFPVGTRITVEQANLNNGYFTVTGNDNTNLTVDPPPKSEGALTVTIRGAF